MEEIPTKSTLEERIALRSVGFFRADGMKIKHRMPGSPSRILENNPEQAGRYGSHNGWFGLFYKNETWLRHTSHPREEDADEKDARIRDVCESIFPRKGGGWGGPWIPLNDIEDLDYHELLARVTNPDHSLPYSPV